MTPLFVRFRAVSLRCLPSSVEPQYDAAGNMGGEGDTHKKGFKRERLVVWSREKEICVGRLYRSCHEREDRGVGDVGSGEDGEDV